VYYNRISDFVFASLTGDERDGLRVVEFEQGNSRFAGFDGRGSLRLHPRVWLHANAGFVNAALVDLDQPLPRIPPLHGRLRIEVPYRGIAVGPEVVWASRQSRIHGDEIPTGGYAVVNLNGSYVVTSRQAAHIFAVKAYNLANTEYRVHSSFIKDLAPEIGRGVKVSYSVRFF
jgi:iron complex outermembrane recepter protein